MRSLLLDGDVEGARVAHARFASDPRHGGGDTEEAINRLGYDLLERHRPNQAVAVLRLNVERYPESSNAHDSLGEALAAANEREAALASYRESLRLDPSNENAIRAIEKLQPSTSQSPQSMRVETRRLCFQPRRLAWDQTVMPGGTGKGMV
jgi:predicted Zn-dependent protease